MPSPAARITYSVVVEVPPSPPTLTAQDATRDTVQLVWTREEGERSSSLGYILSYRPEGSQVYTPLKSI